jgi:hypothetical protein
LVGGYWLFTTQASVRLFVGQWAPPLQDAFYMLLNQYKGQDFVSLSCPFAVSHVLPTRLPPPFPAFLPCHFRVGVRV